MVLPVGGKESAPPPRDLARPFWSLEYLPSAPSSALVLPDHHHIAGDGEQADDESENEIWGDSAAIRHGKGLDLDVRSRSGKSKIEIKVPLIR